MIPQFYQEQITPVIVNPPSFKLNTDSKTLFIGSCFSTNLYKRFKYLYLDCRNSPFGNVYNPLSISNSLSRLLNGTEIGSKECINEDGIYQHPDFHSTAGNMDLNQFLKGINDSINNFSNYIKSTDILVLTFGTAYVFEKNKLVVNNCHKLPRREFNRRALTVQEITDALIPTLNRIKQINSKIEFVLTLSPVRHLRDDATENSLSKAILRVSIDEIRKQIPLYYFPSYEILLDELRDYRWYDKSLTHPNREAIDYITANFIEVTASNQLKEYIKKIEKLNKMFDHKIINRESESTKTFIKKREERLALLISEYPNLQSLKNIKSSQYL